MTSTQESPSLPATWTHRLAPPGRWNVHGGNCESAGSLARWRRFVKPGRYPPQGAVHLPFHLAVCCLRPPASPNPRGTKGHFGGQDEHLVAFPRIEGQVDGYEKEERPQNCRWRAVFSGMARKKLACQLPGRVSDGIFLARPAEGAAAPRSVCREFGIHFDVIVGPLELFPSSPSEDERLIANLHGRTYLTECLHVCVCARLPAR